jgi:hypothetical protein
MMRRVDLVSDTRVAYGAGMTPNSAPSSVDSAPRRSGAPTGAGSGVTSTAEATIADMIDRDLFRSELAGVVWFLARCARCGDAAGVDNAEPFRDESERDDWAAAHIRDTGHVVRLSVDKLEELPDFHLSGVLSADEHGGFRYVCPADACSTSCGPFPTPQVAIGSWRTHKPGRRP